MFHRSTFSVTSPGIMRIKSFNGEDQAKRSESLNTFYSFQQELDGSPSPRICKTPELRCLRKSASQRMTLEEFPLSPGSPDSSSIDDGFRTYDTILPSDPTLMGIRTINPKTFRQILKDNVSIEIIDCRFPFEYNAGHIKGAINLWNEDLLMSHFPVEKGASQNPSILLFYCEFSGTRAPSLAKLFRKMDEQCSNPYLIYNEIYLIDKGFCEIYTNHKELCEGKYVKMCDERHDNERKECSRVVASLRKKRQLSSPRLGPTTSLSSSFSEVSTPL